MKPVIALGALLALAGCGDIEGYADVTVGPPEIYLDLGSVPGGARATRSFTIESSGRVETTLALAAGTELPPEFELEPTRMAVRRGEPATFTLTFRPCGRAARSNVEFYIDAPGADPGRIHVVARGIEALVVLDDPGCLQFGTVTPGESRSLPVSFTNAFALDPVRIQLTLADGAFSVAPTWLEIPHGESRDATVTFTPPARGRFEADLTLQGEPGRCTSAIAPRKRCLEGMAALEAFELAPPALDFAQGAACGEVTIHNTGDLSIRVRSIELTDGLRTVPGAFALQDEGLAGREIDAAGTATFQLCFAPPGGARTFSGEVRVATDNHLEKLPVTARSP